MNPTSPRSLTVVLAALGSLTITACTGPADDPVAPTSERVTDPLEPTTTPTPTGAGTPSTSRPATEAAPLSSDGRARPAELSIPSIGLTDLVVAPYRGRTDDAPGTEIQNDGRAASPHGPRGGTGPGGIGNYQVTAHRFPPRPAFLRLPELERGDRVPVRTEEATYVYRITGTRETSFRSAASLRAQRAPSPAGPGRSPPAR